MSDHDLYDLTSLSIAEPFLGAERPGLLRIHPESACRGEHCPFHWPSDHHMRTWPINVRLDRAALCERKCPHGVGHPDPDSLAWLNRAKGENAWGVHGCDGCCSAAAPALVGKERTE